jgi:hypothetical protein
MIFSAGAFFFSVAGFFFSVGAIFFSVAGLISSSYSKNFESPLRSNNLLDS